MSVVTRGSAKPAPDDEMTLAQIVRQMQALREQMDRDQAEIDRLKLESHAIKLETQALNAQTRAALDRLTAMVKSC
jgi:hypothetical protein